MSHFTDALKVISNLFRNPEKDPSSTLNNLNMHESTHIKCECGNYNLKIEKNYYIISCPHAKHTQLVRK